MSATSSSIRCSSAKESRHSPATAASSWSCWRNTGSAAVSCTSATAPVEAYRGASPVRKVSPMSNAATRPPKHPPLWFVHTAWRVHRALYRLSGGRLLWTTSNKRGWGALRLTTIGRKTGEERSVIIGYLEDGPHLVAIAMNG